MLAAATDTWPAAENVDLSTVPNRDTVQLTIYNSEDLTLVRETRKISFKTGRQSAAVQLGQYADRSDVGRIAVPDPHRRAGSARHDLPARQAADAVLERAERNRRRSGHRSHLFHQRHQLVGRLRGHLRRGREPAMRAGGLRAGHATQSGEDYENAQVRLVVGTINLTEKIAALAQLPMDQGGGIGHGQARRTAFEGRHAKWPPGAGRHGRRRQPTRADVPKDIIKEGLSEYFIYTIEGTETIPNGWSKRMRSFESPPVPMKTVYRYRVPEYGEQLVRLYTLANDKASTLGETPLPDGIVRLFRHNDTNGLSFVTAQPIKYVPIGDKIELNLGPGPGSGLRVDQAAHVAHAHVWMLVDGTSVYRQVDDGAVQIEVNSSRRRLGRAHVLHAAHSQLHGQADSRGGPPHAARPHHVPQCVRRHAARLPDGRVPGRRRRPEPKTDLNCEVVQHCGHNEKQNNVTLEPMDD